MKNKNKNVAWATFRTATQVVAIMAVILVTLIACGKSDSGGSVDNKNLIGTWVWESGTVDGVPESVFTEKEVSRTFVVKNFFDDVLKYCDIETKKGSYSVSGSTISIIWEDKSGGSATISIVGNKLILSVSGEDDKGKKHTLVETYIKQ